MALAREANEAKNRFIAMLSHELCTPLTPVLASLEILEAEEGSDLARLELARIRRSIDAEVRLIDDLLDIVRIRRGAVHLEREWVALPAVVAESLASFGADGRRVRVVVPDGIPPLLADRMRLRQVLTNLLRNALTATREGGDVAVRAEAEDPVLRIVVEDTGVGIERGRLQNLFTAFDRGDSPGSATGGLGLGLIICRALVTAHGGSLEAHSDGRGKGARFAVTLPVGDAASASTPFEATRAAAGSNAAPASESPEVRRTVLLVDDHVDTAHSLSKLLERRGYTVRVASSLAEALAVAEEPFDVLVSDLALGDGTGHELLERLRGRRCEAPAIAVSGFGSPDDLAESQRAGFSEHLTKPLRMKELLEVLKRITAG